MHDKSENKSTETEIVEALINIQKYCNKHRSCKECGIYDEHAQKCAIRVRPPGDWKINEVPKKRWRALK